jgi:hypothetical protein
MCCKINNFNDVISNIVYTFGGLFQIFYRDNFYLGCELSLDDNSKHKNLYLINFFGISSILVSIGSAYYHLNPKKHKKIIVCVFTLRNYIF